MDFEDYDQVFTPSRPIALPDFCVGREQEFVDLKRYLRRKGEFPILIGNRGVGKTSLAKVGMKKANIPAVYVNCYEGMTFPALAEAVLEELGTDTLLRTESVETKDSLKGGVKLFQTGIEGDTEVKHTSVRDGTVGRLWTPRTLYKRLADAKVEAVIVIDEFDRVATLDTVFHREVADFLKTVADNAENSNLKLIIVGISKSAVALLGEHRSIERSVKEVYVRPLRHQDVLAFLGEAEELLGFRFDPEVRARIVYFSMGFPYYVHLVGEKSLDAMTDRLGGASRKEDARVVSQEDFLAGLKKAMGEAFQSNLSKYRNSVRQISDKQRLIVKTLCLLEDNVSIKRSELRKKVLRRSVDAVASERVTENEFDRLLLELQQRHKIIYIGRSSDAVRFSDPLIAPFLRSWYFKEALIPKIGTLDPSQMELFVSRGPTSPAGSVGD